MARNLNVAIVGAGVAGLAAATLLSRARHRVTVFERFAAPAPIGSGLMLQPTGLAALDRLGCRGAIERLGERIDAIHGATAAGKPIFGLRYAGLGDDLYAVAVHRAALHGVLWDAFRHSDADLVTGRAVAGVDLRAAGRAALVDDAGAVTPAFDLIVDASGARSRLRPAVCGAPARDFSYGAVWASVPDRGIAPGRLEQRYVGTRVMLGYLPVGRIEPGGRSYAALFWSLKPESHAQWRDGFETWRGEAARLWPELAGVVADLSGPDAFTLAHYVHATARRVARGPVALIGDAAHATSPQLGQGANHGLADAVALADAISTERDLDAALAQYARRRKGHVRFYQLASALMTPFFQSDSRVLGMVRDATFHRLHAIPYVRREMVRTLAGLKTGVFTCGSAEEIVGRAPRLDRQQALEAAQ